MSNVPPLTEGAIEAIAKLIGDNATGSDIDRVLADRGLVDDSGLSTKWKRLHSVFLRSQKTYHSANQVLDFVQAYFTPARFVRRPLEFETLRQELNTILVLCGLEFGADGQVRELESARTLDEAQRRVRTIRAKFQGRAIHPEVLKYCSAELMQDNYFHAVFEATKGLAQRIRDMSGVQSDGVALIDRVFSIDRPLLAINALRTETEITQHKGFAALLKGCFAAVRNPLAHEPKILWDGEDDAADYLSLVSLLHRKLDNAVRTPFN